MRILFVTPYVPSLVRVRPFNFIRQLSRHHEVTLVSLAQGDPAEAEALEHVRGYCEKVYTLPLSKVGSLISCCRRLLTPVPLQAAYTDLPFGKVFVSRIAESGAFDVLHVEHIRGAHLAGGVSHVARVYDSVDCITRLLKQKLAHRCGALQRALGYEELLKMRSYEPRVASTFDSIVITSEHDKRALEWLIRRFIAHRDEIKTGRASAGESIQRRTARSIIGGSQSGGLHGLSGDGVGGIAVVRNGVDSEYFRPVAKHVHLATIVFSGKMSYFANSSAALRFYEEAFPLIRRARPDARFKIVGSDPPDAVRRLARDPAVEVTGYVPDIRPHLASAWVVACPLTIGVGMQNKVLEAMAMGKPVVLTSVARSGIPGTVDGQHLIYADDSARMAEAIVGLLNNPEHRMKLGESARRLVIERYNWEAAVRGLEAVYERAVDAHKSGVPVAA